MSTATFAIETKVVNDITYRQLPAAEWSRLKPIFDEQGWFLPNEHLATAIVAENLDGEIVHVQMYQLVLHGEPVWTHEGYRGKVNYKTPINMFKDKPKRSELLVPGVVIVAPDERIETLAREAGYGEIPGKLFKLEW